MYYFICWKDAGSFKDAVAKPVLKRRSNYLPWVFLFVTWEQNGLSTKTALQAGLGHTLSE